MKNKKLIYIVVIVLVALVGGIFAKKDDIKLMMEQKEYKNNIKFLVNKKSWKDITSEEDGLYVLTSEDCPYCIRFSSSYEYIVSNIQKKVNVKRYLVEVDMDKDFKDKNYEKFYEKYGLETIPSMLLIKDGKFKVLPTELIDKTHQELNKQ